MTILLPTVRLTATGKSMRGRFISLFVLLGILFCGIVEPAIAHAENAITAHGNEMFAIVEPADPDHGDSNEQTGAKPCHVASHHCCIALAVDAPSLTLQSDSGSANTSALAATAMSSLSQAPPIEPPAA